MKKEFEDLSTGIVFGLFLYFLGAIDFYQPISYVVIVAVAIIIFFPLFKIVKDSLLTIKNRN
ncbi:hypothetical protein [uncultured Polaribacter sp.]|uniref:hypothetical protein n=1 Tax=uncultured Polaribacter sp. TaxID=174711 RepID=UPI002627FB68|nr:hypothetical protein [uncultured Polaribacter sp.]